MAYSTVTLTGTFHLLDASPAQGLVTIAPSRPVLTDPGGDVILSGSVKKSLDAQGSITIDLPATDGPTFGEPFTYTVTVAMNHAYWSTTALSLPAAAGTFDLADVPGENIVQYVTAAHMDAAIDAALAAYEPVTISTTPPGSGLWVNPTEEA